MTTAPRPLVLLVSAALFAAGCGDEPAAAPEVDAASPTDRGAAVTVDAGTPVTPVDAGTPVTPVDAGTPVTPIDAGSPTTPMDAGCVYEAVTLDRNAEPRNAAGHIRWCWPGEPRCACDRDDDCYPGPGYVPLCATPGAAPRDAGTTVPADRGTAPRDVGTTVPADLGNTGTGLCSDPVPATSTGPVLTLDTIHFNWSMQCYRPEDGSLFVFVEDTENAMVALRFYDFLNNGGPATGDTIDLSRARAGTRPFILSSLSGIVTEPTWSAQHSYLAYEGEVVFHQLQRSSPIGTRMRVEFRNVRAREVRQYTNGRCENVVNGARMVIRSLTLDLPVNNLHTDEDCVDWAGG
ncbi:MAG: hypothetical protein JWM10_864 [Myxococcaceae bacterium]|nr:hypothetical protein [Myxococcaceae bacterium]